MSASVTVLPPARPPRRRAGRLTNLIHEELDRFCLEAGVTKAHVIARKVVEMAEGGNLEAIKFIADRVEGKVAQTLNISDDAGIPYGDQVSRDTPPVDAMRIYRELVGAGPLSDSQIGDVIEDADNVISLAARRPDGEKP